MIRDFSDGAIGGDHDVCIVGSGPVGLATALACAAGGLRVLVLEAGGAVPSDDARAFAGGVLTPGAAHAPLDDAACRALGGTSHWWGGRCIPFDPVDFRHRPNEAGARWPIGHQDVAPWHGEAAAFFGCGPAAFCLPAAFPALRDLRCDQVERWCPVPNMAAVHGAKLRAADNLTVVTGATVVDLEIAGEPAAVTGVVVAGAGRRQRVPAPRVVLACGGVQTCRLLLTVQRRLPHRFGGAGGPLGRYYMGHVAGKVADIRLRRPESFAQLDFFLDGGAYVRRRFTLPERVLVENDLPNISFALGNPRIADPRHGSGVLSLLWTALASPLGRRVLPDALRALYVGPPPHRHAAHLRNMLLHIPSTAAGGIRVLRDKRFGRPRKPATIFPNKAGLYALYFHAEQSACAENRIVLSGAADALGMPLPAVAFRYAAADAARIGRAHDILALALADSGIGRLICHDADMATSILRQASDGLHQIGGARMSTRPGDGVVDADCRVHDVTNLYVAGSSVFPTSGNANPTFLAVALALRLAEHLVRVPAARAPSLALAGA